MPTASGGPRAENDTRRRAAPDTTHYEPAFYGDIFREAARLRAADGPASDGKILSLLSSAGVGPALLAADILTTRLAF